MEGIEHLDFAVQATPDVSFDEYGLPLCAGQGLAMWEGLIRTFNTRADKAGWDQPHHLFAVESPASTTAQLAQLGVTPEQVVRDFSSEDTPDSIDDTVILPTTIRDLGYVASEGEGSLWGRQVPEQCSALLMTIEARLKVPYPLDDVVDQPSEASSKKKGRRGQDRSQFIEPTDVRIWCLVTKSGIVHEWMFYRVGRLKSKLLSRDGGHADNQTRLLGRVLGVAIDPHPEASRVTTGEAVSLWLTHMLATPSLEVKISQDDFDFLTGSVLLMLCDPMFAHPPELIRSVENLQQFEPASQDSHAAMRPVTEILMQAYATSPRPTWLEACSRSFLESRLLPDEGFPPTAELAHWAGEDYLSVVATGWYLEMRAEAAQTLSSLSMVDKVRFLELLNRLKLPIPG